MSNYSTGPLVPYIAEIIEVSTSRIQTLLTYAKAQEIYVTRRILIFRRSYPAGHETIQPENYRMQLAG